MKNNEPSNENEALDSETHFNLDTNEDEQSSSENKSPTPSPAKRSKLFEFLSWAAWLGGAVIVALFISFFIIINSSVPSGSMESTILIDDRIIGNRLAYVFSEPKRGEIIIFKSNDDPDLYLVKRLIGLPGETVEIKDGVVYIDGAKLVETYLGSEDSRSFGPYYVPADSYFFLGDNRASSLDARFWDDPYIHKDALIGKVLFKYYNSFKTYSIPDYGVSQ